MMDLKAQLLKYFVSMSVEGQEDLLAMAAVLATAYPAVKAKVRLALVNS